MYSLLIFLLAFLPQSIELFLAKLGDEFLLQVAVGLFLDNLAVVLLIRLFHTNLIHDFFQLRPSLFYIIIKTPQTLGFIIPRLYELVHLLLAIVSLKVF